MRVVVVCLPLVFVGCLVTRSRVTDPAGAVAMGPRADVVSVDGTPRTGHVRPDDHGYALVDAEGARVMLAPDARVKVEVSYNDGDVIPGEGVLRSREAERNALAGGAALAVGGVFTILGLSAALQAAPPCDKSEMFGCFGFLDLRPLGAALAVLGGITAVTGIGFLIAAAAIGIRVDPIVRW